MEACSSSVKILVDLDVLLDTRLGAVSRLAPEVAVRLVDNNWINRDNDIWQRKTPEFTYDQYREIYFRREIETLMMSRPTDINKLLFDIAQDMIVLGDTPDKLKSFELVINLDRYPLSQDETTELENLIFEIMPFVDKVRFIRTCIKRLTVNAIKQLGATYYICYDLYTWLRANNREIVSTSHLWLTVLAPAVREHEFDDFEDAAEIREMSKGISPFTAFEFMLSVNINLRFCETKYFSLTTDIKGGA